ncbi:Polygalacturonase inhibitor 1-like protein, partial [Drosera capensis]
MPSPTVARRCFSPETTKLNGEGSMIANPAFPLLEITMLGFSFLQVRGKLSLFNSSCSDHPFQIPPSVGGLAYLEDMFFSDLPNLVGSIPDTVANLSHLQNIRISNCRLSGHIPSFLGQIKSLQSIDLNTNNLSGSMPSSLGQLPHLSDLNLYGNNLTGAIPEFRLDPSFNKQNPLTIVLSNNNLSGPIPKSFGNISIQWIDVSGNQLTGDASFLFGHDKAIWYIRLSRNRFSFDFSHVTIPSFMEDLDISENKIYGSIPASLGYVSWDQFN